MFQFHNLNYKPITGQLYVFHSIQRCAYKSKEKITSLQEFTQVKLGLPVPGVPHFCETIVDVTRVAFSEGSETIEVNMTTRSLKVKSFSTTEFRIARFRGEKKGF